jgi:hypothetical protein
LSLRRSGRSFSRLRCMGSPNRGAAMKVESAFRSSESRGAPGQGYSRHLPQDRRDRLGKEELKAFIY